MLCGVARVDRSFFDYYIFFCKCNSSRYMYEVKVGECSNKRIAKKFGVSRKFDLRDLLYKFEFIFSSWSENVL